MTTTRKTDATQAADATQELGDRELEQVTGGALAGYETFPRQWKMASLDGKGNDVLTEEMTIAHESIKRD